MSLTPEEQVELEELQANGVSTHASSGGFTPSNYQPQAQGAAQDTLSALGKAAGVPRAATTGPLTGLALAAMTGKPVPFSWQEMKDSFNPTNLKQFPSNNQMMERVGLHNPTLSDTGLVKKDGLLDVGLGGAVQTVTDPAMWMGVGEAPTAAQAALKAAKLASSPTARTLEALGQAVKVAGTPGRVVAQGIEATPYLAPVASAVVNPLGALAQRAGRSVYGSTMGPVEHEGDKFGKEGVVQNMRDAGIVLPFGMEDKAQEAANTLMQARKNLFSAAQGSEVNIPKALEPGYAEVARLKALGSEDAGRIADALQKELDGAKFRAQGIAGTPASEAQFSTRDVPSSLFSENGQPLTKSETVQVAPAIAGKPGIPAQPYSPQEASDLKSFWTSQLPNSTFNEALTTPVGARGLRNAAGGLKTGIEDAVEAAVPGGAKATQELNQSLGSLVGTRKGQIRVSQKADRDLNNIIHGTGMDAVVGAGVMGATGNPESALKAIALKKAIRAIQLGTMPTGYALESLGNSNVIDRLNSMIQEEKQKRSSP